MSEHLFVGLAEALRVAERIRALEGLEIHFTINHLNN